MREYRFSRPQSSGSRITATQISYVMDTSDKYIPLSQSLRGPGHDLSLMTFITPWGRYRYHGPTRVPQGYMASGDGYSGQYDEVVADIGNKTKCVDDTVLWADTIEESYFQSIQCMDVCGRNGVILIRGPD